MSLPRYIDAAAVVRAQIADGTLKPGSPAPSAAALARATGISPQTCGKAIARLIKDGILVPGPTPTARPRVAGGHAAAGQARLRAARELSASLASRRRAAGLTQARLAEITGGSATAVVHAETLRLWQARRFWEHADKELGAGGDLLALYDDYRACRDADKDAKTRARTEAEDTGTVAEAALTVAVAVACVTITWADGTATSVYPPQVPAGARP